MQQTCGMSGGRNAEGDPCGATMGLAENGLCSTHDPDRVEEMQARRIRGGKKGALGKQIAMRANAAERKRIPRAPKTLDDAVKVSSWAIRAVAIGEIDIRVCREIQYGIAQFRGALEKRDVLREVEELRRAVAALQDRRGPRAVS